MHLEQVAFQSPLNFNAATMDVYYIWNGRLLYDLTEVPFGAAAQKHYRLRGGKGGFGSMLRAIGSQIEKTTNHEMCRDLSGRRMRDVNMEAKLKEWYSKASERDRDKMEKYHERRQKRKEMLEKGPFADHKFSDREYDYQKRRITYELQSALDKAISSIVQDNRPGCSTVPTSNCMGEPSAKRARPWLQDLDGLSSSSAGSENSSDSEQIESKEIADDIPVMKTLNDSEHALETEHQSDQVCVTNAVDLSSSDAKCSMGAKSSETVRKSVEDEISLVPSAVDVPVQLLQLPYKPKFDPLTDAQLRQCDNPKDIEQYGLDVLKESLVCRGLKCGGTLSERSARLFAVKDLEQHEYPAKLRAKSK